LEAGRPKAELTAFKQFSQLLEKVSQRRRELLKTHELPKQIRGRLLVHGVMDTDSSGYPQDCSESFLDVHDCPPHDTWICLVDMNRNALLISWIPEELCPIAERGIECCSMWCTDWIDSPKQPNYDGVPVLETLHRQWLEASGQG
jgi:hypothetical protein